MYKVIATAPTVYQSDSVRQFGSPILLCGDGRQIFSRAFDTQEQAKEYLKERALMYYDTDEEVADAMDDIEKYCCLTIDAVTASIERIGEW
jgi:hypothetical protein